LQGSNLKTFFPTSNEMRCYYNSEKRSPTHPIILRPRFLQFLEIWFEKSGSRNLVREIWFEKSGSRIVVDQKKRQFYTIDLWRKVTRKKNPSLQNHFSTLF
jgi:hypothetical protein